MIYGFFGDIGSGKTLTMTKYVYLYYNLGYNIYSNYNLEFPHKKIDRAFMTDIVENDKTLEGNNLFAIDEIGIYMDSRKSVSKENVLLSYFIKQVRKKEIKLFYTEQFRHAIDKRLRGLTRTETICHSKDLVIYDSEGKEHKLKFVYNDVYINDKLIAKKRILANKYYGLYDTKELITT